MRLSLHAERSCGIGQECPSLRDARTDLSLPLRSTQALRNELTAALPLGSGQGPSEAFSEFVRIGHAMLHDHSSQATWTFRAAANVP